ncbi:DUF397 domain-containing protein [Streptomyces sp. NBC_00576]|uniref:DUF397 domain-containing protein n=1 Tax=Streptomyces sp. NBC_00576 TaxID=2903665 RepID=UPI003FCD2B99
MTTPDNWQKSSYSGGADGNNCVEIAPRPTQIAIRDSKAPADATLAFRFGAFKAFVEVFKVDASRTASWPPPADMSLSDLSQAILHTHRKEPEIASHNSPRGLSIPLSGTVKARSR